MNPLKKVNTWVNTIKIILLIISILIFFPIAYSIILPLFGNIWSVVIYFVYLFIIAMVIRRWSYKKFGE